MILILVLFLLIFVSIRFIINPFEGVLLYIFVVLLCPYLIIGNFSFRIELVLVPLLFLITLLKKSYNLLLSPLFIVWIIFVIYLFLVSLINSSPNFQSSINFISFYNYLRFGALIIIGSNLNLSVYELRKFNKLFFYLSIPIAILAIGIVLGNSIASSVTESFYTSPTRIVFSSQVANINAGFLFRSIGVFENVSYYASFILVTITLGINTLLNNYENLKKTTKYLYWFTFIINFIAGITASSLTFYVGFVILLLYIILSRPSTIIKQLGYILIFTFSIFFLFFKNLIVFNQQYLDSFTYLLQSLFGGEKISERYSLASRENGDLTSLMNNSWIQGNGYRVYDKIVVNDSLYLEFFYQGGLIGSIILFFFIVLIFIYTLKSEPIRSLRLYMVLVILLITGIGCNSLTIVRMSEWFWLMVGMLTTKSISNQSSIHVRN